MYVPWGYKDEQAWHHKEDWNHLALFWGGVQPDLLSGSSLTFR